MARNYYSEINLHCTWHCKESAPMLTPQVEPVAQRLIHERIVTTPGVFVHEIGGTDTHIHIALTIPPTLTISEFVGQIKGATSHEVNEQFALRGKVLQWQAGYGVVSFGTRRPGMGQAIHTESAWTPRHGKDAGSAGTDQRRGNVVCAGGGAR